MVWSQKKRPERSPRQSGSGAGSPQRAVSRAPHRQQQNVGKGRGTRRGHSGRCDQQNEFSNDTPIQDHTSDESEWWRSVIAPDRRPAAEAAAPGSRSRALRGPTPPFSSFLRSRQPTSDPALRPPPLASPYPRSSTYLSSSVISSSSRLPPALSQSLFGSARRCPLSAWVQSPVGRPSSRLTFPSLYRRDERLVLDDGDPWLDRHPDERVVRADCPDCE